MVCVEILHDNKTLTFQMKVCSKHQLLAYAIYFISRTTYYKTVPRKNVFQNKYASKYDNVASIRLYFSDIKPQL